MKFCMALRNSRFLKAKASCRFVVAGRWKQMNLGKTPKDWQFRKKFKSNSAFRALIETFSSLRRSEMLRRPSYMAAMSWIMEPKGRVSRKQIVIFKKVTTCFNFEDMSSKLKHVVTFLKITIFDLYSTRRALYQPLHLRVPSPPPLLTPPFSRPRL